MVLYKGPHACPACGKASPKQKLFCSSCDRDTVLYHEVQIPRAWANALMTYEQNEQFEQCKTFSKRHNYRLDLLILKLAIKHNVTLNLNREHILFLINMEDA
jgi:predicted nucleic acid-binding Zn ribbon protein